LKSYRKELWFHTPARREFINIASQVHEALRESGIQEGFVLVKCKSNPSLDFTEGTINI